MRVELMTVLTLLCPLQHCHFHPLHHLSMTYIERPEYILQVQKHVALI